MSQQNDTKDRYKEYRDRWNEIFGDMLDGTGNPVNMSVKKTMGIESLDDGISWLCEKANTVLDFGCGSGTMLFLCEAKGTKKHIGIDSSKNAIKIAEKRKNNLKAEYDFKVGSIQELKIIKSCSVDALILSNIIDIVFPDDAKDIMEQCTRILKRDGRALIKMNPFITQDMINQYGMKTVDASKSLIEDGTLVCNHTTEEWIDFLNGFLTVVHTDDVLFKEQGVTNRLFLLKK